MKFDGMSDYTNFQSSIFGPTKVHDFSEETRLSAQEEREKEEKAADYNKTRKVKNYAAVDEIMRDLMRDIDE